MAGLLDLAYLATPKPVWIEVRRQVGEAAEEALVHAKESGRFLLPAL
jgi:hypothetical protein